MSRRCWVSVFVALLAASIYGAASCSSTPGGPEPLQTLAYGAPLAAADPQPAAPASVATAPGICTASAPVVCDLGCCPQVAGCDDAGILADAGVDAGCIGPTQQPGCPVGASVLCSAPPNCDGGGCVAIDSSGNGNTGALFGAGFGPGRFGTGLALYGSGNEMVAPTNGFPDASAPFTVELWFKLPADGGAFESYALFVDGLELDALPDGVQWGADEDIPQLGLPGSSALGAAACKVSIPVVDGQWHFVGASWDPALDAGAVLVVDSAAASAACSETPPPGFQLALVIGQAMNGWIDEVRALDVALDASALAADADAGPFIADAHTLALWHFDEGDQYRCCPDGSTCGPGGECNDGSQTAASCPADAPVSCLDGCCPAGTICVPQGCAQETTVTCPSSQPVLCSDGTCCPTGYTCVSGGHCSIQAPSPPPDRACPAGYDPSTPTECCPTGSSYDSVHGGCDEGPCPCPTGFTCQKIGTQVGFEYVCRAGAAAPLCSPTCGGGCCDVDAGQTCGGTGCCNAATPACGSNPTCCDRPRATRAVAASPTRPAAAPRARPSAATTAATRERRASPVRASSRRAPSSTSASPEPSAATPAAARPGAALLPGFAPSHRLLLTARRRFPTPVASAAPAARPAASAWEASVHISSRLTVSASASRAADRKDLAAPMATSAARATYAPGPAAAPPTTPRAAARAAVCPALRAPTASVAARRIHSRAATSAAARAPPATAAYANRPVPTTCPTLAETAAAPLASLPTPTEAHLRLAARTGASPVEWSAVSQAEPATPAAAHAHPADRPAAILAAIRAKSA